MPELLKKIHIQDQDLNQAKQRADTLERQLTEREDSVSQKVAALSEEKNALLDYIEQMQASNGQLDDVLTLQAKIEQLKNAHEIQIT